MSHLNTLYLPERIAVGAVYGPAFVTEVNPMISGREQRNRVRSRALCEGDLSFSPTLAEDYPELLKHFRAVNGRFHSFRMIDVTDYECDYTEGIVAGLTSTTFQLQKKYLAGSNYELRDIQQPIAITLKYNGVALTGGGVDYTLDTATGIVTISGTHTASLFTWSGTFANAVRFDVDKLPTRIDASGVFTAGGILIKEVLL